MKTLLALLLPVTLTASQDIDPEKMMEAGFHLNEVFDQDLDARVPVGELGLPESATGRFDTNGDGFVTFDEYEEMAQRTAPPPSAPKDRSAFTHLTEGGYPLNVDPKIVTADQVDIGDDDLVMGIVLNGEARAYPVNYMNGPYNEVVNDELGGQAIAPSW